MIKNYIKYRVVLDLIHFAMAVQSGCYFWVVVLIFQEVNTLILNAAIVVGGTLYYCDGLNSSVGSSNSTANNNYNINSVITVFINLMQTFSILCILFKHSVTTNQMMHLIFNFLDLVFNFGST